MANERKSLFAKKELIEKLIEIAKRKGLSLYNLVNEVFGWYIRLDEAGVDLYEVLEKLSLHNRLRRAGFVLVPKDLWLYMVKGLCTQRTEVDTSKWFDVGTRLGKYYSSLYIENQLNILLKDLEVILGWLGEVHVSQGDKGINIVIAGPDITDSMTRLAVELLKGMFKEFGYQLTEFVSMEGVLRVVFSKQVMS